MIVQGKLDGNIRASERAELTKSAVVTGDIATQRVAIEEGAYFKGKVDIQRGASKTDAVNPARDTVRLLRCQFASAEAGSAVAVKTEIQRSAWSHSNSSQQIKGNRVKTAPAVTNSASNTKRLMKLFRGSSDSAEQRPGRLRLRIG